MRVVPLGGNQTIEPIMASSVYPQASSNCRMRDTVMPSQILCCQLSDYLHFDQSNYALGILASQVRPRHRLPGCKDARIRVPAGSETQANQSWAQFNTQFLESWELGQESTRNSGPRVENPQTKGQGLVLDQLERHAIDRSGAHLFQQLLAQQPSLTDPCTRKRAP